MQVIESGLRDIDPERPDGDIVRCVIVSRAALRAVVPGIRVLLCLSGGFIYRARRVAAVPGV